jgi:hypothetical protein
MDRVGLFEPTTSAALEKGCSLLASIQIADLLKENFAVQISPAPFSFFWYAL